MVSACCLLQKAQNVCPSLVKKLGSNNSFQRATCASKNGLSARSIFNQLQVAFTGRQQFAGYGEHALGFFVPSLEARLRSFVRKAGDPGLSRSS